VADGERFAVKELAWRRVEGIKDVELFEREAKLLRELDHRQIPRWIEDFEWGVGKHEALYIVEELREGRTVAQMLREEGRWSEERVVQMLRGVASVLMYLHEREVPIVHRDIKAANVMYEEGGEWVLLDFGAARDVVAGSVGGSTVAGTFGYMAPEQLLGRASAASDVYALGALCLELLTGQAPHHWMDYKHEVTIPARLQISVRLRGILGSMLEADVARRLPSAREVVRRLDEPERGGELVVLARSELERGERGGESLFGFSLVLLMTPVCMAPCIAAAFGVMPTMVFLSMCALALIVATPFLPAQD
jgi:serine/threonine protein kinase